MKTLTKLSLVLLLIGTAGCASMKVSRTVALPGLPPVADANQVSVVERLEDVNQPYQLVGKVTVSKLGARLDKAESAKCIRQQAARMGADGVIGLHTSSRGWHYSGLTVKWLETGVNAQPVQKPFIIAALPVAPNPNTPGRHEKLATKMREDALDFVLETKGYYVLPGWVSGCSGGLDEAKHLDPAAYNALGGSHAQSLLELTFVEPPRFRHYLLFATTHAALKMTVMDKPTRATVVETSGTGGENTFPYLIIGGPIFSSLIPVFIIGPMRTDAALLAANNMVYKVSPIGEELTP